LRGSISAVSNRIAEPRSRQASMREAGRGDDTAIRAGRNSREVPAVQIMTGEAGENSQIRPLAPLAPLGPFDLTVAAHRRDAPARQASGTRASLTPKEPCGSRKFCRAQRKQTRRMWALFKKTVLHEYGRAPQRRSRTSRDSPRRGTTAANARWTRTNVVNPTARAARRVRHAAAALLHWARSASGDR
jgi:hypothetical protein